MTKYICKFCKKSFVPKYPYDKYGRIPQYCSLKCFHKNNRTGKYIRCKTCGKDLDLTEVDIDCDLKTHNPMCFELKIYCYECEADNNIKFSIKEEK